MGWGMDMKSLEEPKTTLLCQDLKAILVSTSQTIGAELLYLDDSFFDEFPFESHSKFYRDL